MIISIASGKGGTGKTTVATNLAVSLESDVQILDCDVEEPNSHLFIKPTIEEVKTITTPVPEVDMDKCTLCGKCAEICQFNAIVVIGETVLPFHELCHSCGGCMEVCPEKAITETERELGIIEKGHRNGLVINRSDMGDDQVRVYAEQEGLPILMEIPFERQIAEAYSRGGMVVDVMPEWKERFKTLYHDIREIFSSNN